MAAAPALDCDRGAPSAGAGWCFLLGLQAHYLGHSECPFLAGGFAAQQWQAGWREAAAEAARDDKLPRVIFNPK